MKKRAFAIAAVMCALALAACGKGDKEAQETGEFSVVESEFHGEENEMYDSGISIRIVTDKETGVQYIVYSERKARGGAGGITPRLNADGSLHVEGK